LIVAGEHEPVPDDWDETAQNDLPRSSAGEAASGAQSAAGPAHAPMQLGLLMQLALLMQLTHSAELFTEAGTVDLVEQALGRWQANRTAIMIGSRSGESAPNRRSAHRPPEQRPSQTSICRKPESHEVQAPR